MYDGGDCVPSECQNVILILKNEAFEEQGSRQGMYQVSDFVNEKPSWISIKSGHAIWYVQEYNEWVIGDLEDLGTTIRALTTIDDQGYLFPFNVTSDKWYYLNGQLWKPGAVDDIAIKCTGNGGASICNRRACGYVDIGTCPNQVLASTSTLSQPWGADYAHPIIMTTQSFESHRRTCVMIYA